MSSDPDVVQRYLDELAVRLHGPAAQVRRVLAETEAHLYDGVDASASSVADPELAQAEAVARYGSPAQVAAAVNQDAWTRVRRPVVVAATATLVRLAAAGLIAMGITGLVARVVAAVSSTAAVYGFPAGTQPPVSSCRYWLSVHPGIVGCQHAATLEASSDVTLTLGVAGLLGVFVALALAAHRPRSARPVVVLPPMVGPAVGAAGFGLAAVGSAVLAASDAVVLSTWGAGLYWSAAATCTAAAAGSTGLLIRALPASYTAAPVGRGVDRSARSMTTAGRPARTAPAGLRPLVLLVVLGVGLGVVLGVTGAKYLLVGSALSLLPWGLVAALIGYTSPSRARTTLAASGYAFALAFAFMIAGYQGQTPITHRLPPFALLALAGHAIKGRGRRLAP